MALVSRTFADRLFPGLDPIGRRVRAGGADLNTAPWRTIVGVVPDLVVPALDSDVQDRAAFYFPLAQRNDRFLSIAVRAAGGNAPRLF